jgi:cytochrome P450
MDAGEKADRASIFEVLLSPSDGYPVPTPEQVKDGAISVLAAAADTTGNALTVAAYNVVNNPEIYKVLTDELKVAFPSTDDTLDFLTLEKLPYLVRLSILKLWLANIFQTGVIKEGLL